MRRIKPSAAFEQIAKSHIKSYVEGHDKSYPSKASLMLRDHPEVVKEFDKFGTLLHYAIYYDSIDIARELFRLGSDVNYLNYQGKTPLIIAVRRGCAAWVSVLLEEFNANVDIVGADGVSALQMVFYPEYPSFYVVRRFVRKLKTECLKYDKLADRLITAGGNMAHAATSGDVNLIECMLERGININSTFYKKWTALHYVAEVDDLQMADWLIINGADANALDEDGSSPLTISANKLSKGVMKILLDAGADPNCKNIFGYTPLFAAFQNPTKSDKDFFVCIEMLFERGAIPQNSSRRGTIFDFALLNWSRGETMDILIGQLAMLQMHGILDTKSIMYCDNDSWKLKVPELNNLHEKYLRILEMNVYEKISLFHLLNESQMKMKLLVRKESFLNEIQEFCSEHNLAKLFPFSFKRLIERISNAVNAVKIEDKAIKVICKLFNGNYNMCYVFSKNVIGYLNEWDLQQLSEV